MFPGSQYQEFIYTRTYSRYLHDLNRRETWEESVDRYAKYMTEQTATQLEKAGVDAISVERFFEIQQAFKDFMDMAAVGSMRAFWTAGPALDREHIAGYNCAYVPVDRPKVFAEILYILLCGTGVGFSVETREINKLPFVPYFEKEYHQPGVIFEKPCVVFEDSKEGWAQGFLEFINYLYAGYVPDYDLSKIRPKGTLLKTFGGRASGPEPLRKLLENTARIFRKAQGRKLVSLEVYDIVCHTADAVVVGGVRRSATICLTDLYDKLMRFAKTNDFWKVNPHRFNSNNSVAYNSKPLFDVFWEEWETLAKSGTGERGIVNREGLVKSQLALGRALANYGVNPCGEIVLRPRQFCNLSEVIVRTEDSLDVLCRKVRSATILGTLQSTLTDFGFLDPEWKANCEEERLLGVSLTGTCDHPVLAYTTDETKYWLEAMKREARHVANIWADLLGINRPKAITCVKPSGTVSQLVNSSSGLHPRYSKVYQRRVQITKTDPLADLLIDQGIEYEEVNDSTWAFKFCVEGPENSVYRNDRTAIEQLEYWLMYKTVWCDHNPSVTIYVEEDEWDDVGLWVWENWDHIGGLSFFPKFGGTMPFAPYEELEEPFAVPEIDFKKLPEFEVVDSTQGSKELACSGGACEL